MQVKESIMVYNDMTSKILRGISEHKPDGYGAFAGKMGAVAALYLLKSKCNHAEEIERQADILFDEALQEMQTSFDMTFDKGLLGACSLVNFLHVKGLVKGDIDDVLYNMDAMSYKFLCEEKNINRLDINWTNGLMSFLLYFMGRVINPGQNLSPFLRPIQESSIRIIINRLCYLMQDASTIMRRELNASATWSIPMMFYCLSMLLRQNIYRDKIIAIVHDWSTSVCSLLPCFQMNRVSFANSLLAVNQVAENDSIQRHIKTLYNSVDTGQMLRELKPQSDAIINGWPYYILCLSQACYNVESVGLNRELFIPVRNQILNASFVRWKERLQRNDIPMDCSLVKGVSGVGILYALHPDIFQPIV